MPKEEVYKKVLEQYPPSDGKGHYLMALYCKDIGLYQKGLDHIDEAVSLDESLEEQVSELRTTLQTLLNANEFRISMRAIKKLINQKKIEEAYLKILEHEENTELEDQLKEVVVEMKATGEEMAVKVISERWYRLITVLANRAVSKKDSVSHKKMTYNEAKSYARGQMDKDIVAELFALYNKNSMDAEKQPIDEKLIKALFKKRNADKFSAIKISLNAEAFKIKMTGVSKNNSSTSSDDDIDPRKIWEKFRNGDISREDAMKLWKKYRETMKKSSSDNQPKSSKQPRCFQPSELENDDSILFQFLPSQPRGNNNNKDRSNRGNRNNRNNKSSNNNKTKKKTFKPDEIWKVCSASIKRNFVIYHYCERKKEIKKIKEKMKGKLYYAWYR